MYVDKSKNQDFQWKIVKGNSQKRFGYRILPRKLYQVRYVGCLL